jgi:hypothetical protein
VTSAALTGVFGSLLRIHVGPRDGFVARETGAIETNLAAAFSVRYADSQRLTGALAPRLTPRAQSENDGIKFSAYACQMVLVSNGSAAIRAPLDHPVGFQTPQSRDEHLRRGACLSL